jgi:hypothetical protein
MNQGKAWRGKGCEGGAKKLPLNFLGKRGKGEKGKRGRGEREKKKSGPTPFPFSPFNLFPLYFPLFPPRQHPFLFDIYSLLSRFDGKIKAPCPRQI